MNDKAFIEAQDKQKKGYAVGQAVTIKRAGEAMAKKIYLKMSVEGTDIMQERLVEHSDRFQKGQGHQEVTPRSTFCNELNRFARNSLFEQRTEQFTDLYEERA